MTERLLEELDADSVERLKWLVCRRLGIVPGSWSWRLMTGRRAVRLACHMALDARDTAGAGPEEAGQGAGFDMERFRAMKEAGL